MFVKLVVPLVAVFLAVESAGLLGGPVNADINSPPVQKALHFAVTQYNAQSNSVYTSKVVKVIKAQTQVVAGVKYIFNIVLARTTCKKGRDNTACPVSSNPAIAQAHKCRLAVWSQPWLNSMKLIENTC